MIRLIVCAKDSGVSVIRSFDANCPEMEDWLSKLHGVSAGPLSVKVQSVEFVEGKPRRPSKPKADGGPSIPACPYEDFLAVYHQELCNWAPPEGSSEQAVNLRPVANRYGKVWKQRKKLMDEMWRFILTSKKSNGTHRATNPQEALVWLRAYFCRARRSDWMMGRRDPNGWIADFDYLVAERTWEKVISDPRTAKVSS